MKSGTALIGLLWVIWFEIRSRFPRKGDGPNQPALFAFLAAGFPASTGPTCPEVPPNWTPRGERETVISNRFRLSGFSPLYGHEQSPCRFVVLVVTKQ